MNEHADECMNNKTHLGYAMPTSLVKVINKKEKKKLLVEIMNSGNFGHYDSEKRNIYHY